MIETRVEKHIIKNTHPYYKMLDEYCFLAKNLYNSATYKIRQRLFDKNEWLRYEDLDKLFKTTDDYIDYKSMPCAVNAQQTLRYVDSVWKSYFQAHKDWKKHPEKYTGEPKLPKYKDKTKGRSTLYLTNQACILKEDNYIKFPKAYKGFTVKMKACDNASFDKFKQCRILSRGNHIVVELAYDIKIEHSEYVDNCRYLGIDLGVDNLAAVSNNVGAPFYIINGKGLKSMNRYWNKLYAQSLSNLTKHKKRKERRSSNSIDKLTFKRNQKINDYLHKASRWIVDFAANNQINTIVIGKNKFWKQKSNLSSEVNQKFVQLPHAQFINMITYKAESVGIKVVCVEESYTSKTSFLDHEDPFKHDSYKGRRIYRGLFKTSEGFKINADSNGALQIIKKYVDYEVPNESEIRIALQQPIILNVS